MPKLKIKDGGECEIAPTKRLVNALIDECKIDQLHACGGFAKCTTCRVQFVTGEPEKMTQAEKDVLTAKGLLGQNGLRLSCQILCDHDMEVRVVSRFEGSGRKDSGARPEDAIAPPPVWTAK
jgi:ferredoxin